MRIGMSYPSRAGAVPYVMPTDRSTGPVTHVNGGRAGYVLPRRAAISSGVSRSTGGSSTWSSRAVSAASRTGIAAGEWRMARKSLT